MNASWIWQNYGISPNVRYKKSSNQIQSITTSSHKFHKSEYLKLMQTQWNRITICIAWLSSTRRILWHSLASLVFHFRFTASISHHFQITADAHRAQAIFACNKPFGIISFISLDAFVIAFKVFGMNIIQRYSLNERYDVKAFAWCTKWCWKEYNSQHLCFRHSQIIKSVLARENLLWFSAWKKISTKCSHFTVKLRFEENLQQFALYLSCWLIRPFLGIVY